LTRNEKIQQAKRVLNENKYSLDAWAILIQDAQEKGINESRDFYESLIAQFPTCGKFWKMYIEAEVRRTKIKLTIQNFIFRSKHEIMIWLKKYDLSLWIERKWT